MKPHVAQSRSALDDHIPLFRAVFIVVNTTAYIATLFIDMAGA